MMKEYVTSSKKLTRELENQISVLKLNADTQGVLIKEKDALIKEKNALIKDKDALVKEKDKTITGLQFEVVEEHVKEKETQKTLRESIKRNEVSQDLIAHYRSTKPIQENEHMSQQIGWMTHEIKNLTARVGILLQAVDRETSLKSRLHRVGVDVCTEKVWATAVKAMTETDHIRATMHKGKLLGFKVAEMSEKQLEDYYKTLRQELASHKIVQELDLKFDLDACTCTYCNHISKAVGQS